MKNILLVSFLALISVKGSAQAVSSITINAGPDKCASPTATLTATATQTGFPATTQYTATSVPYTNVGYDGTDAYIGITKVDDVWLNKIFNIGFSFSYYGNTYTQLVIGVNGEVTFDLTKKNTAEGFDYNSTIPGVVNKIANIPNNTICAVNRDINPAQGGTIYTKLIGTAPCRSFVISWVGIPLYNAHVCPGSAAQTFQLILRESTNIIDVNIQTSTACTGVWQGGGVIGVQAVQNGINSVSCAVPSRNSITSATAWSASNESWRFSPNGTATTVPYTGTITWTGPNGVIGTGASINVSPTTGTVYTASISATNCNGTLNASDWTYVNGVSNPNFSYTVGYQTNYFTLTTTPADVSQPNNWDFNYCHRVELWNSTYTNWLWKFDYCKYAPGGIWSNYPNAEVYKGFDHYTQTYNTSQGVYDPSTYNMPTTPTQGRFKYNQYYRIFRLTSNSMCGWREMYVDLRVVPAGRMHNGVLLKEPLVIATEPRPSSELDASVYANGPTGIVDAADPSDLFHVYPNPSNGIFTVDVYNDSKATLQVIDITGKTIKTVQLNKYDNYTLDLSGYAKGAYMIKVNDEQQQQLKKIVIE